MCPEIYLKGTTLFWEEFCGIWILGSVQFKLSKNFKKIYCDNNVRRDSKKREEQYPDHSSIGYHPFEFGLDSGQNCSEIEEAELYAGIITDPRNAE